MSTSQITNEEPTESRFFFIGGIPATKLDALLLTIETEGHRLVWLRTLWVGTTNRYAYEAMFERQSKKATKRRRS